MKELRQDPLTGRWVFFDTEAPKTDKDYDFDEPHAKSSADCPFCPGRETETPPETVIVGTRADWRLRVVPNRFPAVTREALEKGRTDIYERMSAFGVHEIVIEHPDHHREMADFTAEELELVFEAYVGRYRAISKEPGIRSVLIFKNYGAKAGASLEHPHTQIIALPVVPHEIEDEIRSAETYAAQKGHCLYCRLAEGAEGARFEIAKNAHFTALAPYASRFPFEVLIVPRRHGSRFESVEGEERKDLALLLKMVLVKLRTVLKDPPFNFFVHTPPLDLKDHPSYHWHLEILPKIVPVSAFEWGTGSYVNPTPPEVAASILRLASQP